MAIRKSHMTRQLSLSSTSTGGASAARKRLRAMILEQLEQRQLLAVGPQLIGIQPNNSDLLVQGAVRDEAPRELVFRFDDSQVIDPQTLSGIRLTRAGGDGSFAMPTAESDFGSNGRASILLTGAVPGVALTVNVSHAVLATGTLPTVATTGSSVSITLNTNAASPTTAAQLIQAINSSPVLSGKLSARLNGGTATAQLGMVAASSYSPVLVQSSNDQIITPGAVLIGDSPNENEVTLRFAETLRDDLYRIEVFGFDDPASGVVGLRNVSDEPGTPGDLFVPSVAGTRKDTIDFHLDLGPQVTAVVPQPVVRVGTALQQQRDTVMVYFDSDKLLVENDNFGRPSSRSVENPEFYQLIFTSDTVRNTDDQYFLPTSVQYNALTNTATLKFSGDLNDLVGSSAGPATYRLRIGTRESAPIVPTRQEASATVITDLNTGGLVQFRFTARETGEPGNGIRVAFTNSQSGTPTVSTAGRVISVDLGRANFTAQELYDLIRNSSAAMALVSVDFVPGSDPATVVGNTNLAFSPVTLVGLGGTFDTSMDLGVIGSGLKTQTSIVLASAIEPRAYFLDLPGASDDAAHRNLPQNTLNGFENHINPNFGADDTAGVTTIYYNFRSEYSQDSAGTTLINAINADQQQRAREILRLWSQYIGVQFVETSDLGLTIATGALTGLRPVAGTQIRSQAGLGFGVRIDPTFDNSLIIMSATNTWGNDYAESYSRTMAAALGLVLGLQNGGDLSSSELMRFDPAFLAGSGSLIDGNDAQLDANDEPFEPVFPGNQDILHAQYIHRPDSTDVDLYRFEVDFGGDDRVGVFVAETYGQRLANSSELDTYLQLYRQVNASAETTFNVGGLVVKFDSLRPGVQGNQFQVFLTQSDRGDASLPSITVFPNAISIDLNATSGFESTVQDLLDAVANSSAASRLVKASLVAGDASATIGDRLLTQNPVTLLGGKFELVAQNDDYFGRDSFISQSLTSGVYYIGVSSSGNNEYNAAIEDSGFGGRTTGQYELRVNYRAAVDTRDTIQDLAGMFPNDQATGFDGDGDGIPGGTYDFWFQTRPLNRTLSFNAGGSAGLEGRTITVVGANGTQRVFEYSSDAAIGAGRIRLPYTPAQTAADLANALAAAITSRPELGVSAVASGIRLTLSGERSIAVDPLLTLIDIGGKTIFADKSAGPNADGSLARPFNNIAGTGVANAFAATHPGDIVRIVGNGGTDNNLSTEGNNFAYEIGTGLLAGTTLSDGITMDIPRGVTTMVDAGVVFKLRGAAIQAGSSNLNINRNAAVLQVLGTPILLDAAGNALRSTSGKLADGKVYFTSWLDETIGLDTYAPSTVPGPGDWGGLVLRRDVDSSAGRQDLEDEGIFLRYVNQADIRYGGGTVIVDSIQQPINPIQMLGTRPTITNNRIQFAANAALSADPNAFEETNFNEPRFQINGAFTSDYDRVGPSIRGNVLTNNSINALFISVETPADGSPRTLTVPGRFDDTDIVHVLTDNLIVAGAVGGSILDSTSPQAESISTAPSVGGTLLPGTYNYKMTFVDRNGYESVPSNASINVQLLANQTAVSLAGLPGATGDFVARRLYRSTASGQGPYELVATLDRSSATFRDIGQSPGGTLSRDRVDVSNVISTVEGAGTLASGTYNYRVVLVDAGGRESLASNATDAITVANDDLSVRLTQLPATSAGFVARRIYRSSANGSGPYVLIGELPNSAPVSSFVDTGATLGSELSVEAFGVKRPRLSASLVIDPGMVIKLEAARIEAQFGTNIIAEGVDGSPIYFTSRLDDSIGAGGTFDTNNNGTQNNPAPRDWGGIYMSPTSQLSVDHARFSYGGGVTKLEGTFRAFNTIELHQADARIANTIFEDNADGTGGQGPGTRLGRLSNSPATIFVRGTQPIIIDNIFRDNVGSAIRIDVNSMTDELIGDIGRQTGLAERDPNYLANRGPLIRNNRLDGNDLNGLEIRGGTLTTGSVWDDTDIAHVVFDPIFTGNIQHVGGLRLQSAPTESLVVKFFGYGSNFNRNLGAGITANGQLGTATDRVGGTLHVVGQPGFPVILTSLRDDTVGAGLRPDGNPQNDTNNDGIGSIPQASDWRGVLIDQYANDRNVAIVLESEDFRAAAPGPNGSPSTAQVLGDLAASTSASNESLRLGFVVEGVLSQSEDVDVYSFTGAAGTEVWLDIDYTKTNLDMVLELLDANGNLLARSDSSTLESQDPSRLLATGLMPAGSVNPLNVRDEGIRLTSSGLAKEDGTTSVNDPGMRVRLPGSGGSRSTYYFRVRSAGNDIDVATAGLSAGAYQVQVRLREAQEWAGSTVNFADIRYSTNGVHLRGMPGESPLIGEAGEDESVGTGQLTANNGVATGNGRQGGFGSFFGDPGFADAEIGNRPQYIGNILDTAKGAISVAGNLSTATDLDFYMLEVNQEDLVGGIGNGHAPVVFDIDYADGLNRPDISINVFIQEPSNNPFEEFQYRLVYTGDSSNIVEDQARPMAGTDMADLSRGSAGTRDAFIGPVALQEGIYLVAISSAALQPRAVVLNPSDVRPINSIRRIVDEGYQPGVTTADPPVVANFLPRTDIGVSGELVSAKFDLGSYATADQANIYLDYSHAGGSFELFVRDANGVETLVATSAFNPNIADLPVGVQSAKIPLSFRNWDFAGQNGLELVFRSSNPLTEIDNIIIGFAERGEQVTVGNEPSLLQFAFLTRLQTRSTREFSLETYVAGRENPALSFNYEIFNGNLDVFVVPAVGFPTRIATSVANELGATEVLLVAGAPQTVLISLNRWADEPGLRIEFRTRDEDTNVSVENAFILLSDGARVGTGEPNSTFTPVQVPSTTITSGSYQLEVRLGDTFFQSQNFGTPLLTQSYDTNDRLTDAVSIVAPAGADITAGDKFQISDGGTIVVFEFTLTGAVGLGNVAVRYSPTDTNFVVARKIRDAINSPGVQSRLRVRSATSSGIVSGTVGSDPKLSLFGNAVVETVQAANPAGEVEVIFHQGRSDSNVTRDQGQVLIQNSNIRQARDYSIWSEPAGRLLDPRDQVDFLDAIFQQSKPGVVGTQAVRNLLVPNNSVQGGLLPGVVIQNNVLEEGGLGGINISGESPIWMISPLLIPIDEDDALLPTTDNDPTVNANGSHFGFYLDDGDQLVIDSDRTRLRFEFEDLAGGATAAPVNGSGTVEGNGYLPESTIAWYRDQGGDFYQRLQGGNLQPFATTAFETMHALRDSILGSILVTNGTTQMVKATIARSLMGPDPLAVEGPIYSYPEYDNRPAVYLEGVTNIQFLNTVGGGNPFDIRTLALGQAPQPHARVINNTIIGKDGRASFNGESALSEPNDTLNDAVQTWQGTGQKPLVYSDIGFIGDGGQAIAGSTTPTSSGSNGSGGSGGGGGAISPNSFVQGRAIIRFEDNVTIAQQNQLLATRGLQVLKRFDSINAVTVQVPPQLPVMTLTGQLELLPEIKYAEPDFIIELQRTPNDPRYNQQWGLNNVGQTGGTTDADINAPEAWDTTVGSSQVVVAIIDSGIDFNHPDLAANMWVNPGEIPGNGIDDDNNGYVDDIYGIDPAEADSNPMDIDGHGTHVAGTVAAVGNNGRGVTGVSWNSKLMALKIFDGPFGGTTTAAIEAIEYVTMMKTEYGVNVALSNNSWGGYGFSQGLVDAISLNIDAGMLFVAAAANDTIDNDITPAYPASYPLDGIISVSASDHNDRIAGFSNFGLTSVDLAAPGVDILSTLPGGGYGLLSGTSMASPHVAGVAALLASARPTATVNQLKAAILLGADPIDSLDGTTVTGARLNAATALRAIGAGLNNQLSNTDVDIYQFKLGTGERAFVDILTQNSGLNAALQIFDSQGAPQTFLNARGEPVLISGTEAGMEGLEPSADFTALKPGVYYAAVSSVGNTSYDPLSQANRLPGNSTGAYRISISARTLNDFVITAQDASAYAGGETFTIHGISDSDVSGSTGVTFEFVIGIGDPIDPTHIPININDDWRFPDVARAIAKAINEGDFGRPAIANAQQLPNGKFGTASPLPPVHAQALGGVTGIIDAPLTNLVGDLADVLLQFSAVDELGTNALSAREIERQISGPFHQVNQGLQLFPRRLDGFQTITTTTITTPRNGTFTHTQIASLSNYGIGHDRVSTTPLSPTSLGNGATEKFVVIKNAAMIDGNGVVLVSPDLDTNNNLDQLIPETGILATRGASPTILNNVFFNVQTPIVNEESRRFPLTGGPAPYGTNNPNFVIKPGEVIVGGSIYQFHETASSTTRFATGIETSPTNVPNTALDFNVSVPATTRLFVNAQAGQYLPAPGSPLIDSSIDSLPERPALAAVKTAMGLSVSPVLAPSYDLAGQLRADDPSVAPPSGQGQNVFKDRGALERADFIGPAAVLLNPVDNDALGVDTDPSDSVVQLTSGVYPEFRIQLKDGNEPSNPLLGLGINDDSVVNSANANSEITGTSVVLFENGRMLVEGIDYRFAYNSTRDEIILTPLAGVWKNGAAYEITINNRDRFVINAPAGDEVSDGDSFTIVDSNGGVLHFEYESGYQLLIPQGLTLQIPLAGASFGGIVDGERFSIVTVAGRTTFEFDRNGNVLNGNRPISFVEGASQAALLNAVITAIEASGIAVVPTNIGDGRLLLAAESGTRLDTTFTVASQPTAALGIAIPDEGIRVVFDGDLFTLSDGRETRRFEMDLDGNVGIGNIAVDYSTALTKRDLAVAIQQAILNSGLNLSPELIGDDVVFLGLSVNGSAVIDSSRLSVVGVARTLGDGQSFSITNAGVTRTFEFTRDATVEAGNIPISVAITDTQEDIAQRLVTAIRDSGLGLNPIVVGQGNIALRGTVATTVDVTNAPDLRLLGSPGVQSSTELALSGPLLIQANGAAAIVDGSTFTVRGNGQTVVFEFDIDNSGPSQPGNVIVAYSALSSANDISLAIAAAINGAGLGLTPTVLGGGLLQLGHVPLDTINVRDSGLTVSQGLVGDGEFFTISNGTVTRTFEFDDASLNNGSTLGRIPILYSSGSTTATILQTMQAAINGAGLGLATTINGDVLQLNDRPTFTTDVTGAPTLVKTGVPRGATPVRFFADSSFTSTDMKQAIVDAINAAQNTDLEASNRGGATLYVSGAITISSELDSFFLRGVSDLGGNFLKANRVNGETQFTILMPGVSLDFGDAPDPFSTTLGRYPTLFVNDGARHVVGTTALLGSGISADRDGQPSPNASNDAFDDGVDFGSVLATPGIFNRDALTPVTVTLSSPGFVDGWIDFNGDGDWDDPGERILNSVRFTEDSLTQTFTISVPATAPVPLSPFQAAARFRSSSVGGLQTTGLAVDGEVEDYMVTIVPGTPPVAVNDSYVLNEDSILITNDATGNTTPGFVIDDGVAANDTDVEGGTLSVTQVSGPQHAAVFQLETDGTFLYRPAPNFFGTDTFTYRVNDGVLSSNNIGTVTITVNEANDAPVAANDTFEIDEDEPLDLSAAELLANDVAGPANESAQTLTITGVSQTSTQGGSVSLVDGRVVYTPQENFSGTDTFTYTISDNGTTAGLAAPLSSTATVTVIVADKNDPPITGGDSLTTAEDTPATITTTALLSNDIAGPPAEITAGQTVTFSRVIAQSTNGGTVTEAGGVVTYTPPADFVGTDTFFYEVIDNGFSGTVSDPQTSVGTVTVTVTGVNDAPRMLQPFGEFTATEDATLPVVELSDYFFDPDVASSGDTLLYTIFSNSNPSLVSPTINGGQLVLNPLADQNGQSVVVVRATDAAGASVDNTLTLSVTPVNDAPRLAQGIPDRTVDEDAAIPAIVLSPTYFFDPDVVLNSDVLTFQVVSNSNPLLVTPTISGNSLNLALVANQSGTAVLIISATDSSGQTISDQFTLTVNPVNDVPVTTPDSYTVPQGTLYVTTDPRGLVGGPGDDGVLANDTDAEGATLSATLVTGPQNASAFTLNPNGTFSYQHNGLSRQTDTFTYRASDGAGSSVVTTVTITISDPPPPLHQNPINHTDVNADGFVSPIDVLLIVNFINANGNGVSVSTLPAPPPYRDVDGNNRITPNDILQVINAINQLRAGGEGEGAGVWEDSVLIATPSISSYAWQDTVSRVADTQPVVMQEVPSDQQRIGVADAVRASALVSESFKYCTSEELLAEMVDENDEDADELLSASDQALLEIFGKLV